jgi:hypothetical protein
MIRDGLVYHIRCYDGGREPYHLYTPVGPFVVDGVHYYRGDDDGAARPMIEVFDDGDGGSGFCTQHHSRPPTEPELDDWVHGGRWLR